MADSMDHKIYKLMVMMGKLVTEDERQNRQFKPQVYQSNRGRAQTRHNYEQRRFQDRFRSNNMYRGRPRYGQDYRGRSRYNSNYRGSYGYNMRGNQRYKGQKIITEWETLEIKIMIGIEVDHMKDRIETEGMIEVLVTVDQDQVQEQLQIGIGLEFFCEELFVVRLKSIHSCKSAIYFDLDKDIMKQNCDFIFYYNKTDATPTVLDRGNKII